MDRTCSQMGFFLGLLSSGQKFHFRSADSCYLHKLACLSRNLLNEQEITKDMDHYKRTARWPGTFLQRRLIQIVRAAFRLYIFVSVNNRWTPKLYYINGRLKEVMWRQRGRVVSASDSHFGGPGFESRSGHLLDLCSVVPSSNSQPRL